MRILRGPAAKKYVATVASRGVAFTGDKPASAAEPAKRSRQVTKIVGDVQSDGDSALREYARKWDGLGTQSLRVNPTELREAFKSVSRELIANLRIAAANIRKFAERQRPSSWMHEQSGIATGQIIRPLGSVGCYVPGGRYPLLSTVLMTVIPAQVAGVPRICVASPNPRAEILAAAHLLGIREFYRVGGAQAIAAFAYGTESIPRADKIVGPGNVYVTLAKKLVAFDCSIDMLAGPTEAVIVSHDGNPKWIAADLVAQAEHDPDAVSIFITTSRELADETAEAARLASQNNSVAQKSLARNGCILLAASSAQAMQWANEIAPEHITVEAGDVDAVQSAGSIFVGAYSAQAAGDYASGPNHVLPTAGAARFRGGLSVLDFVKIITVQRLNERGLQRIAPAIISLAEAEGLKAHAESIGVRLEDVRFQHA